MPKRCRRFALPPHSRTQARCGRFGGKFLGGVAGDLAARTGINNASALDIINRLGGGAGVASIISAPTAYQIAQMQPGPMRNKAIQDATSNAILTALLGGIGSRDTLPETPAIPDAETAGASENGVPAVLPPKAADLEQIIRNVFPARKQPSVVADQAKIFGGAYKDIEAGTGENHHTPAASVSTLSKGKGPVVWMEKLDHAATASHGTKGLYGIAYRARQAELIEKGGFDEALQMDIDDIRSKFGTKYDEGIKQMLEYYETIPRWMLKLE